MVEFVKADWCRTCDETHRGFTNMGLLKSADRLRRTAALTFTHTHTHWTVTGSLWELDSMTITNTEKWRANKQWQSRWFTQLNVFISHHPHLMVSDDLVWILAVLQEILYSSLCHSGKSCNRFRLKTKNLVGTLFRNVKCSCRDYNVI